MYNHTGRHTEVNKVPALRQPQGTGRLTDHQLSWWMSRSDSAWRYHYIRTILPGLFRVSLPSQILNSRELERRIYLFFFFSLSLLFWIVTIITTTKSASTSCVTVFQILSWGLYIVLTHLTLSNISWRIARGSMSQMVKLKFNESNFPKVTQLPSDRVMILTKAVWLQSPHF